MRPTASIVVVLSAAFLTGFSALAATQATALEGKSKPHALRAHDKILHLMVAEPTPQRTCDWVGPGGRAVYRCQQF